MHTSPDFADHIPGLFQVPELKEKEGGAELPIEPCSP
jgi:hypothetical protein